MTEKDSFRTDSPVLKHFNEVGYEYDGTSLSVISAIVHDPDAIADILALAVAAGTVTNLGTGAWNAGAPAWHPDKYALTRALPRPKLERVWVDGQAVEMETDYLGRLVRD